MIGKRQLFPLFVCAALAAATDQPWKDKPVAEWSESDARQLLSDSPWAKPVAPRIQRRSNSRQGSRGGMGRGGINIGGIGIGGPRIGGRGGGMGRVPTTDPGVGGDRNPDRTPPSMTVRWESALPVQEAQLKIRDGNSPSVQEGYYTIAVLGIPNRITGGDPQRLQNQLKHRAELKRDGKKAIRSLEARVLSREDGLMVLFMFPKSAMIVEGDKRVEFAANIGPFELAQNFELADMIFAGKLAL